MQDIYQTFEFHKILSFIGEYSKSGVGKEKILSLKMYSSYEEVESSLKGLEEIISIVFRFGPLPINPSVDTLELIQMAKKTGLLSPRDLYLIANDVSTIDSIISYQKKISLDYPFFNGIISQFYDLTNLQKEIKRVITSALTVDDNASVELKQIRGKIRKLENSLNSKAASLVHLYSQYLSDDNLTIRDGHFVLPVKTAYKNKVMGAIYDLSDTGNTTFIEPLEIISMNNEITALKIQENEEVRKILKNLTNIVLLQEEEVVNNNRLIGELDFYHSKAQYALATKSVTASMHRENVLDLISARHPLIDPDKVISNTYHLDEQQRIVIISGPNAGGKTVSLKTIGLLICMNQCGLALPVEKADLGYFKHLYIDIGDNQSLSDNLSTFSAHMSQIGEITRLAKKDDLILIDELGTGTDPREGEALAIAVIDKLLTSQCFGFISSHFSALKNYALENPSLANSCMLFDEESLSPTYLFKLGSPGRSYGIEVAERYGVDPQIISHAKSFLNKSGSSSSDNLILILNKKVEEVSKLEQTLLKEEEELNKKLQKVNNDEKLLKQKRESLLESVKEEKQNLIDETKQKLDEVIKLMNKGHLSLNEVIELKKQVEQLEEQQEQEIFNEEISVGDNVSIPSLGLYGKVTRINGSKGRFISESGISLEVELNRLHKVEKNENINKIKSSKPIELDTSSVPLELNIIGYHVDEGRDALQMYLDKCRYKHLHKVRIIHGFGSGALRKMVHEYLSTQKDLSFKLADGYEGGGGATVVTFNE